MNGPIPRRVTGSCATLDDHPATGARGAPGRCLGLLLALAAAYAAGTASASEILQTSSDSLTTYRAATTSVQGVGPRADQRGVGLDGVQRASGALSWALAGNPFEGGQPGETLGDLRLATGAYSPTTIDLSLPARVPWVVGRTHNALQQDSAGARVDSNGHQGLNWFQISQPEIRFVDTDVNPATKQAADLVYLVYGADRYIEFKRTADNADTFRGVNGAAGVFTRQAGTPDLWVYTDPLGNRTWFFGGNTTGAIAAWQLWKFVDPAGNSAYVGHPTSAATALAEGYDAGGRIVMAFDSEGRRFCYTYQSIDRTMRLTSVTAEIDAGGGWGACGTETQVGKVKYEYYEEGDDTWGDKGNLKLVTIFTPLSESGQELTQRRYYRYYKGTFHATTNPGHPNTIKMVLGSEGVRKFGSTFNAAATTDETLRPYADAFFKYDQQFRVISVYFDGECGCGGGTNGQHVLSYEHDNAFSGTAGYDTVWQRRVVVDPPEGGAWVTQYFDELGQPLSRVLTDGDPAAATPPPRWVTRVIRNADGQVTEVHSPASNTGYTHGTSAIPNGAITTSGTAGLVSFYQRVASGATKGFLEGVRQKEGTNNLSGDSTFISWTQHTTRDLSVATGVDVRRPLIEKTRAFHAATTNHADAAAYDETTREHAWWSSSSTDVLFVTLKSVTTTAPAVGTDRNGSGVATSTRRHLRKDGTTAFTESARGIVAYTEHQRGQVIRHIEDAKTTTGTTYPAGDHPHTDFGIATSSTGLHRTTEFAFDQQGRPTGSTLPNGRVTKTWYGKLGDDRMVTLSIPRVSSTTDAVRYHGPSGYTTSNHAGSTEACILVDIVAEGTTTSPSGWIDSNSADPITAFKLNQIDTPQGSLARLTTSDYGKTGRRLESRRVFFTMPTNLGATATQGSYDEWTMAYDHMGRQVRVADPSGTISRTAYDALGRVTSRSIGTNDSGQIGGSSSGTNTMVDTELVVYDHGSAGGNSLPTSRTQRVEAGATGQRETSLIYDARGRLVVTLNPQPPHSVFKHDNLGRAVAAGLFSSSTGLTAATDPVTTTANRVALTRTFYDQRGRVWKTQRHRITQSTGADADHLESLHWYDPDGRPIKADGEQLTKTRYDRVGRAIQVFTLASDNDAAGVYGDVYDAAKGFASVAGDTVLQETQIGYNGALDEVLVRATIERAHDDTSTTGPLDTTHDGGDGLPLTFTAADVKGRIQITATWYDELDRPETTAFYGTNSATGNAATFDRAMTSKPSASTTNPTTVIVTRSVYNTDGTVRESVDAKGRRTRFHYDAAGRVVTTIANTTGSNASSFSPDERDEDLFTRYVYAKGLQTEIWVDINGDGAKDPTTDQVTKYVYGTTKGTPGSGPPVQSAIATGHLLREVIYPPGQAASMETDRTVTFAYNAQGEPVWTRDQMGNIIQTDYDTAGRETHRRVTALNSDFDNSVLRISTTYLARGLVDKVTQYTNAAVGSGSLVDDVKFVYDDWGNVVQFRQDVDSDLDGAPSGRPAFQMASTFAKATAGRNTLRRTGMTLPGETSVDLVYLSSGGRLDHAASRVSRLDVTVPVGEDPSPVPLVRYEYMGLGRLVGTDLLEPKARWHHFEGATSGTPYPDLDRFNRVKDSRWTSYKGTGTRDFYDVDIAYDEASNILGVTDHVHKGAAGQRRFDALYTLDQLHRLRRADEGTLTWSGGVGSISNRSRDERWETPPGALALSQAGNWHRRLLDLNGDGDFTDAGELNDTSTFSQANELLTRDTDSNGTPNFTALHDKAGHLTNDGQHYKYVYDAFGRLRLVKNRTTDALVAEYRSNGLGFRIGWRYDADASGSITSADPWYWFCYDESWRVVATFRASDANPKEVFVHHNAGLSGLGGSSHIDSVVLRDRDASTGWISASDAVREERRYYCQNWRADVSAILTDTGSMAEWVKYSAYGVPFALPAGDTDADGDWDAADQTTMTSSLGYDLRHDANLDGVVNSADVTHANSIAGGFQTLGRGRLSSSGVGNRRGYAGYEYAPEFEGASGGGGGGRHLSHVRHRVYDAGLGRWTRRDPLGYVDGMSLYAYVRSMPIVGVDPTGLFICVGGCDWRKLGVTEPPSAEQGPPVCLGMTCGPAAPPTPGSAEPGPIWCSGGLCSVPVVTPPFIPACPGGGGGGWIAAGASLSQPQPQSRNSNNQSSPVRLWEGCSDSLFCYNMWNREQRRQLTKAGAAAATANSLAPGGIATGFVGVAAGATFCAAAGVAVGAGGGAILIGIGLYEFSNRVEHARNSRAQAATAYCACLAKRARTCNKDDKGEDIYANVDCNATPITRPASAPHWPCGSTD